MNNRLKQSFCRTLMKSIMVSVLVLELFGVGSYGIEIIYGTSIILENSPELKLKDVRIIEDFEAEGIDFERTQQGYLNYLLGDLEIFGVNNADDAMTVLDAYEETFDINSGISYKVNRIDESLMNIRYDFDIEYKGVIIDSANAMLLVDKDAGEVKKIAINIYNQELREMFVWEPTESDLHLLMAVLFSNIVNIMYFVMWISILLPFLLSVIHFVRYRTTKLFVAYMRGILGMILGLIVFEQISKNVEQPIVYAIIVGVISTLCFYLILKISKSVPCWERSVAAGLGYSTTFIVINYSLGLWVQYSLKVLYDNMHYIVEPEGGREQICLMNGSVINNVEVATSADYLIVLFEVPFILIMVIAIITLMGVCVEQQKDFLGIVGVGGMIVVIIYLMRVLGTQGYVLYSFIGVAGFVCILATYRLEQKNVAD